MASDARKLPLVVTLIFVTCVCALLGALANVAYGLDERLAMRVDAERASHLIHELRMLRETARAGSVDPSAADGSRAATNSIIREAELILVDGNADADRSHSIAMAITMWGSLIAVLLLMLLLYGFTRRYFERWIASEELLRDQRERLESVVAARTRQLSQFCGHLIRMTDREKARLARELHDELGSHLTAINLDVAAVGKQLGSTNPGLALRLQRAVDSVRTVVGLNRRMIENLRPSALDSMGLAEALRGHCEDFSQRTGLACAIDLSADLGGIDPDWSIALFSVAQEALSNAARHAKPAATTVSLRCEDQGIRLLVIDDGVGVPCAALDQPNAHGLLGMRERIFMLGGSFELRRGEDGRGTVVDAFVPYAQARPEQDMPAG
ncbi:MAG: sensor histidine kinase [Betaproteobacteria bacterium]|nr:sensor histidine kinase [Betaproteobacteria bacterium]